jgi:hypothetical protein
MEIGPALEWLSRTGAAGGQPLRSFEALAQIFQLAPGYLLFSLSRLERDTWLRRIYSTDPARHRPGATKDMEGTGYCEAVIRRHSHLLSRDAADLRVNFQDHDAMIADGIGCAINLCLQYDGRVVGSANLLSRSGDYGPDTLAHLAQFAFPLALLVAHSAATGDITSKGLEGHG